MSTIQEPTFTLKAADGIVVTYDPDESVIAKFKAEHSALIDNPDAAKTLEGYREVAALISHCVKFRSAIERRRVDLKADVLRVGRLIDSEAKRLTSLVEGVEGPLRLSKSTVDEEKARVIREKQEAERLAKEAEARAAREAEEAKIRAEREAEREKNRIEAEKLAAERKAIEDERAKYRAEQAAIEEAQKAERAKLEAEQRAIREQREALERLEFEKAAKERAEAATAERLKRQKEQEEQQRIEAEKLKKLREIEEEAERVRIEAAKPDTHKIHALGQLFADLVLPEVTTDQGRLFMAGVKNDLAKLANTCKAFTVVRRQRKVQA